MSSVVIRPREREAILQALRAGVVPRVGQQHIQVARINEVHAILKDIDRIADGGFAIRFVIGEYGSGKTFFLHLIRSVALERKLVTVHADLSPDRRLRATSGQARSLFSELMRNMSTRSKPDGGAMGSVVERFITQAVAQAKKAGTTPDAVIHQRLADLTDLVGGYDFAEVVAAYWHGYETGNEQLRNDAVRWLRGEFSTRTDACAALGVRTIVDDANYYDHIKIMSRLVRMAGYAGLLVCLDEMVILYKLANTQARDGNYEQILRILNDGLQSTTAYLGFVFSGTPDFLLDPRRGLYSYPALQSRLAENAFATNGLVDYSGPVLRLTNLSKEDFYLLLTRLRHVAAYGNPDAYLIPDDALTAFMTHCLSRIGDDCFRTPRSAIKEFVNLLAVLEQNPGTDWASLIGNVDIQPEFNPDLVPLPTGDDAESPARYAVGDESLSTSRSSSAGLPGRSVPIVASGNDNSTLSPRSAIRVNPAPERTSQAAKESPATNPRVGQFVRVAEQQLGIGKCVHVSGDEVEIEYFDSISMTGRHRTTARRSQVKHVQLSPQCRCYWEDRADWRVGRVVWQGDGQYGVRPPNSDADLMVPEEELHVRWDKPIDDPTDVLIAHGNESPYFHLRRYPFVATTTRQRAVSHGMHGVISSIIDLYDHQIEVARRVLEDSKQRYLLADEVGLGKTIEAGIIIRQYLLDHPEGHVVVIAPPLLRRQWVSELRQKFLIDDFDRAVVSVLSHDKPESWLEGARDGLGRFSRHIKAGLVVVDEAHHLAAQASAGGDAGHQYAMLAGLTAAVPRLLLLSATPLLNNERTFLAMLHLLDPDIYRLHDIEGFRRRIRDRQALGTAFFTFRSDIPSFLLRDKVSALHAMFPEDEQLAALLDRVSASLDDPTALPDAVMAARIHISETYRVHRRLLRTRRNDTILDDFPVRGRQRPVTIPLADPGEAAQEWLDDWRDYVRSTLDSSPVARAGARRALIAMAERAGSHPGLAAAAARYRLEPSDSHARYAELTPAEQDALSSWAADDIEREILERGSLLEIDPEILPALVRFLKDARRKTVVFTSFTMTARHVREALVGEFGPHAIAAHLTDEDPAAVEEEVDRFRDAAGNCWILVCDRSAEEGRNFQFADQAIHFDLPFSPNRLEQRIGRLDRYGRGNVIPTYATESLPGTITASWKDCLSEGFGVFDTSIASLQFAIDTLLPELQDALLDDGAAGLAQMTEILPGRLAAEREAIVEQDALDAIERGDQAEELASAMRDIEDAWLRIQHSTEGLLCDGPGNLRFHLVADQKDDRYRSYRLTAPGKTPNINSMPLVAWDVLRARFMPVVKRTGTYQRAAAVARPDARLFRIGEPLVDSLADYIRWDDRGQTFAFWRTSPDVANESLYFRFDYVIEADTGPARLVLEARASKFDHRSLQRRADAFLPPKIVTLWSAIDGAHLKDRKLTGLLQAPYEPKRGDINLNPERRWALDELVGEADWEWRCRTARAHSEETLRRNPTFAAACAEAATRFEAATRTAVTQRRIRLTFIPARQRKAEESELAADIDIDAALSRGMRQPLVRLDAVGAVVLAPFRPDGHGFARPRT